MTADDRSPCAAGVAELLHRGPLPAPRGSLRERARAMVRSRLLRIARPQARYQREIDDAICHGLAGVEGELLRVRERHEERIERLEDLVRELILTSESLRRALSDAEAVRASIATTNERVAAIEPVVAELHAPPYMAEARFRTMDTPVGEALGFPAPIKEGAESDYLAFEELFRGPRSRVAAAQRPYLALVRDHRPVLDIGCGRGEFLSLLAEEGIEGYGVDIDAGMVERCRASGVNAHLADALEHLESLEGHSLGTVFSAQVIEHLSYACLRRLLALASVKLRPGSLFIAETVNPHRPSSLKTFWVDLTHNQPIFPEVALALCGIAGFESAYVFAPGFDSFERARVHSPAYAVVATTPITPSATD